MRPTICFLLWYTGTFARFNRTTLVACSFRPPYLYPLSLLCWRHVAPISVSISVEKLTSSLRALLPKHGIPEPEQRDYALCLDMLQYLSNNVKGVVLLCYSCASVRFRSFVRHVHEWRQLDHHGIPKAPLRYWQPEMIRSLPPPGGREPRLDSHDGHRGWQNRGW
jgi:hypothetical protein